jgi:hypothetical protein
MRNSGPSSQPFGDGSPSCALVSALWVAQLKGQIAPLGDSIESIDERGWLNLACRRRSGRSASGLRSGPAGCKHARPPSGTRSSSSTSRALSARSACFRSSCWASVITTGHYADLAGVEVPPVPARAPRQLIKCGPDAPISEVSAVPWYYNGTTFSALNASLFSGDRFLTCLSELR